MPFRIDGKEYFEDINITREEFFEKLKNDCDIATSQPSPESVMKVWDEMLKEYDQIVHVPLTSGLSGSTQTAMMLSHDDKYEGRVFVPDDRGVSVTQRQDCIFAVELAAKGYDGKQIMDIINRESASNQIYIGVDTLKYLKRAAGSHRLQRLSEHCFISSLCLVSQTAVSSMPIRRYGLHGLYAM